MQDGKNVKSGIIIELKRSSSRGLCWYELKTTLEKGAEEVTLRAKGARISTAIDLVEIVKRQVPGIVVKEIKIDIEKLTGLTEKEVKIPTIELIILPKADASTEAKVKSEKPSTIINIEKGEIMNYIHNLTASLGNKATKEVLVLAKGKAINEAVIIVEETRNQLSGVIVKEINISTEEMLGKDGKEMKISVMEVVLSKM